MNNPPEPALPTAQAAIEIKDDIVEKKVADGKEVDEGKKPKVDLNSYFVSASNIINCMWLTNKKLQTAANTNTKKNDRKSSNMEAATTKYYK